MAASPGRPGTIYVSGNGLLRSTDAGKTWRKVLGGRVGVIAVDPSNADRIYITSDSGLYRSTDSGSTWVFSLHAGTVMIDPSNPDTVYAGGNGVYKSTDAGQTWVQSSSGLENPYGAVFVTVEKLAFRPGDSKTLYAATDGFGMYKSTDAGATWVHLDGIPKDGIHEIAIDPSLPDQMYAGGSRIYASSDAGVTWKQVLDTDAETYDLEVRDGVVYAGNARGEQASTDGGLTWKTLFPDLVYSFDLAFDPNDPKSFYLATSKGVFASRDAGATWTQLPAPVTPVYELFIDPSNPATIYVGSQGWGIFRSRDGGDSWQEANTGLSGSLGSVPSYNTVTKLLMGGEPSRLYAVTRAFYETVNGGDTWSHVGQVGGAALAVDPQHPNVWYGGIKDDPTPVTVSWLAKSTDAGTTWQKASPGITYVQDIVIDPLNPFTVYAGVYKDMNTPAVLYKTTNAGLTWQASDKGLDAFVFKLFIHPIRPSILFAIAGPNGGVYPEGAKLYRSDDGAATWNLVQADFPGDLRDIAFDPVSPDIMYAAARFGVLRSTNAGLTWNTVQPQVPAYLELSSIDVAQTDPRTLVVGTVGNGIYTLEIPTGNVFYFPQIANGQQGSASMRTRLRFLNTGADTTLRLELRDDNGQPLATDVGLGPAAPAYTLDLKHGESRNLETSGSGPLEVGYAKVTTGPGVEGVATFSYSENGVLIYQSGVPASIPLTDFSLFLEVAEGREDTGLAIVNSTDADASVQLRLYDAHFSLLATRDLKSMLQGDPLKAGEHFAAYATEIFPEIRTLGLDRGVLTVESDRPLAVVTLRQHDTPAPFPEDVSTTTTFPVVTGRADSEPSIKQEARTIYLPQIGHGQSGSLRLSTTVLLLNAGDETEVQLDFLDSSGQSLPLQLEGLSGGPPYTIKLAKGESVAYRTTGAGEVKVGYAKLTAGNRVGAMAVFEYQDGGKLLFQAGVPASLPVSELTFMVNSRPDQDTGIAFVNTGASPAFGTIRLDDKDLNLKATKSISEIIPSFGPGSHLARFATELFPQLRESPIDGFISVTADQPLAAVTLEQHDDPQKTFPSDLYLLTVLPAIAGAVH